MLAGLVCMSTSSPDPPGGKMALVIDRLGQADTDTDTNFDFST